MIHVKTNPGINEFTLFILSLARTVISDFNKVHIKNLLNDHVLLIYCKFIIIIILKRICDIFNELYVTASGEMSQVCPLTVDC